MRVAWMTGACLLGLAGCATQAPSVPISWRRVSSDFGPPVWIQSADIKAAQASRGRKKTVHMLTPDPVVPERATDAVPSFDAAYKIETDIYDCDAASVTTETVYFDAEGIDRAVVVGASRPRIGLGMTRDPIYRAVCGGESLGGEIVILDSLEKVLAYPAPHP